MRGWSRRGARLAYGTALLLAVVGIALSEVLIDPQDFAGSTKGPIRVVGASVAPLCPGDLPARFARQALTAPVAAGGPPLLLQGASGWLLGALRLRCGSLFPGVLAHDLIDPAGALMLAGAMPVLH